MSFRLGVDVGGTFTDVLLVNSDSGETWRTKTASTPQDQSIGVLRGIGKVCEDAGIAHTEIAQVLHGTTVGTNAILEGKGAVVGLVTTQGFRQVLQIARSFVPGGLAGWIIWPKPEPLAALENTIEVPERIASDGTVITPLDEDETRRRLRKLRDNGIQALAISLINAFANGEHERRIAEIAAEELPGIPISRSSIVLPEMREYERALTTVANSYVQPQVARYVRNLSTQLSEQGLTADLSILRSDGGLAAADVAADAPVTMLMSGPAGGVTGAVWMAGQTGSRDLLTFDMGGTSTDVALVQGLKPRTGRETKIGDLTVRASSVDVRTVGAGGGSIAHVPELTKALRVGPQSAGADPGPAGYGLGGTAPTVTDANVVLGYLPTSLAGGEITLDVDASRAAVQTVADAMGLPSVEAAAAGIIDIVNENMLGGLRLVSVQQGFDPRDFALVAFGGAGPLHANAMGVLTGAWPVIVPPSPGRALRARRCHHLAARRVGPDLPAPVRRPHRGGTEGDPHRPVRRLRRATDGAGAEGGRAPRRLRGRRPVLRAGFRDPDHHRPGLAGRPRHVTDEPRRGLRRRARAAVLVPARHRPRAGQRQGVGQRPAAGDRVHPARAGRRRPGRRADRHVQGATCRAPSPTPRSTTAANSGPAT